MLDGTRQPEEAKTIRHMTAALSDAIGQLFSQRTVLDELADRRGRLEEILGPIFGKQAPSPTAQPAAGSMTPLTPAAG